MAYFLFDIGGTNARFGVSYDGKEVEEVQIFPTPQDFDEGIKLISEIVTKLLSLPAQAGNTKIDTCAGSIAGSLNLEKSQVFKAPNLADWEGKPLKKDLQKIAESEVYLENDAAMAGLGEAVLGGGKNFEIVAYVTLGTGVGGARIVRKKIDRSAMGFEIGHQIIDANKNADLESFIGGNAIEKKYGKKPFDINNKKVWDEVAKYLAIGLNNTIVHWSPDVIIIGGSIAEKISTEKVESYLKEILKIFPKIPPIKKATLGNTAGLMGALHYLNSVGI